MIERGPALGRVKGKGGAGRARGGRGGAEPLPPTPSSGCMTATGAGNGPCASKGKPETSKPHKPLQSIACTKASARGSWPCRGAVAPVERATECVAHTLSRHRRSGIRGAPNARSAGSIWHAAACYAQLVIFCGRPITRPGAASDVRGDSGTGSDETSASDVPPSCRAGGRVWRVAVQRQQC